MKKTGELIKNARESKGLSIHEISLNLKINSKVLKAIEEGDTKNLPAKTFLRGFIKSYANYLKMDVDQVLRTFAEETGAPKPKVEVPTEQPSVTPATPEIKATPTIAEVKTPKIEAPTPTPSPKKNLDPEKVKNTSNKAPGPMVYSLVAVVLVILILGAKHIVEKYQKETVVDTQAVTAVTQSEPLAVIPTTTIPLVVTTTTTMEPQIETKNINPKPGTPTSIENIGEIVIQAKKDVTVDLKNSTGDLQKIEMKTAEIHTFRTSVGIEITISDGSAVDVYVNGKTAGKVGESDKPIKLVY